MSSESQRRGEKGRTETVFKEIMAKNFLNTTKNIDRQIQEAV